MLLERLVTAKHLLDAAAIDRRKVAWAEDLPVDAAWPAGSAAHQRGLIDYISASAHFASIRK